MTNRNTWGCLKLAAAALGLLASSAALAERTDLDLSIPDRYLRLSHCEPCVEAEAESQSAGDSGTAESPESDFAGAGGKSVKELSQETTDPTGELALIFTQFAMTFNDGDLNDNSAMAAGNIVFQPIIPIPLYGRGDDEWRFVSRPTVNLFVRQPVPQGGVDNFDRKTGISDILLPLPLSPPKSITGRWLLALGPDFSFPTATHDSFGKEQWTAGVSAVVGYQADNWMMGVYPQYYWGIADQGRDDDTRRASFGNMFYWFWYNLTDDIQVGFSPTINYDNKAEDDNNWNVPVGVGVAKMTKIGGRPWRIEVSAEYSVVNEDDWGEVARLKFNLIPLIARPIKNPIFGE